MISIPPVGRWIGSAAQDLRFGRRTLLRSPLATGVMIISIALGIGVATAVFTLADVMLMRPLPFPMADRLVVPFQTVRVQSRAREDTIAWTFARYDLLRQAARGLDDVGFAAWTDAIVRLPTEDRPVRIEAITRSMLTTFSMEAQVGRLFDAREDDATNPTTVAVISDRLWRTAFGASPDLVGSTFHLDGAPILVVGIMPSRFTGFTIGADVWLPLRMMARIDPSARWTERLASQSGTVIARMASGMTTRTLGKYLDAALPLINDIATDRFVGDKIDRGIGVTTLADARRHPLVKPILELMAAAVIGLLAIVCANIASILLARGHARRGEMGVRIALGASPRRVARQVLTECALLGFFALPCGILLGWFCADALAGLRPALPQNFVLLRGTDLLAGATFEPNLHVLLFGSLVAAVATVLFAIGPAIAASRVDAKTLIATSGDLHATAPVRGRQVLVVSQIALATILLISAGLTLRSLGALLRVDLGFRPEGVVALSVASADTSPSARIRRRDLITHLSSMPGVTSLATSGCVPFDLACVYTLGVRALGGEGGDRPIDAELHDVSSGYFRTMAIPLVSGRMFADEDSTIDRVVVVISESAARQLYGSTEVIGKQIAFDQPGAKRMDVIGVVRDVRFRSVDAAPAPAVYTLGGEDARAPRFTTTLFLRTRMSGAATAATVAHEVQLSDTPMSVAGVRTMTEIVRAETSTTRFVAALLLGFAVTALLLASLGVYGVVAYTVSQRTKELGLRLVLGADDRGLLLAMVMRGSSLVAVGLGAGVVVALATSRLVSSFLFGVHALDVFTYGGVVAVVGVIGLVATFLPARRILHIDAGAALRA
jgi:putative ABC transport system permease protein